MTSRPPDPTAAAVRAGARAALPLLAGYVPFALVVGSVVANHGDRLAGWTGSFLIFGGSAHVTALRTLDAGGPVAAIFTALLVNARLVVYSASFARSWSGQPRWFRVVAAGLIIDPTWAVAEQHARDHAHGSDPREQRGYFAGAGLTLVAGWSGAIGVGVLLGARLDGLRLDVVVPLCLLGLIGAALRASGTRAVVVVAAVVAYLTASWPSGTGILAAVAAGCATGVASERRVLS